MKDLPTIVVNGYAVDLSWVSLVKAALTDRPDVPVPVAEAPVITIPGGLKGPEFVVTLEPTPHNPDERLFTVKSVPDTTNAIVLLVPDTPVGEGRTGWLRKELLEAIERSVYTIDVIKAAEELERTLRLEGAWRTAEAIRKNPRISPHPTQPDFEIYFHPDLSPDQIEKSFAALADYYRVCGGTGLRVQFEEQYIRVPEVAYDGR
jgi:hypothetical protein